MGPSRFWPERWLVECRDHSIGSPFPLDMYSGEQREGLGSCDRLHVAPMQGKAGHLDTLTQGCQ